MQHIPNILTLFRILLVPLFPYAYFFGPGNRPMVALAIFILASLTDFLDGYIARRFQLITKVGTVLDPLADKLMMLTALMTLYIGDIIPLWLLLMFLVKEAFMITAGIILYVRKEKIIIPSHLAGKAGTATLTLSLILFLLLPTTTIPMTIAILSLLLKLCALWMYIKDYKAQRLKIKSKV